MPRVEMTLEELRWFLEEHETALKPKSPSPVTEVKSVPKKAKSSAYQRRYKKAFSKAKPKHMTKAGKWKKDGFKKAVKEAHKEAKK